MDTVSSTQNAKIGRGLVKVGVLWGSLGRRQVCCCPLSPQRRQARKELGLGFRSFELCPISTTPQDGQTLQFTSLIKAGDLMEGTAVHRSTHAPGSELRRLSNEPTLQFRPPIPSRRTDDADLHVLIFSIWWMGDLRLHLCSWRFTARLHAPVGSTCMGDQLSESLSLPAPHLSSVEYQGTSVAAGHVLPPGHDLCIRLVHIHKLWPVAVTEQATYKKQTHSSEYTAKEVRQPGLGGSVVVSRAQEVSSPNIFTYTDGLQLGSTFHLIHPSPHCHIIDITPSSSLLLPNRRCHPCFPRKDPGDFESRGSDVSHGTDLFCSERGVGKYGVRQKQAPEGVLCVPTIRPAGLQTA
ncbi:hypothetical protein GE21DRAFT_1308176 [Neurospora crassa]|nr:hypothetical protein GE21DRAFT_1308176 [Neurospora crassa]